eukprot:835469_1
MIRATFVSIFLGLLLVENLFAATNSDHNAVTHDRINDPNALTFGYTRKTPGFIPLDVVNNLETFVGPFSMSHTDTSKKLVISMFAPTHDDAKIDAKELKQFFDSRKRRCVEFDIISPWSEDLLLFWADVDFQINSTKKGILVTATFTHLIPKEEEGECSPEHHGKDSTEEYIKAIEKSLMKKLDDVLVNVVLESERKDISEYDRDQMTEEFEKFSLIVEGTTGDAQIGVNNHFFEFNNNQSSLMGFERLD